MRSGVETAPTALYCPESHALPLAFLARYATQIMAAGVFVGLLLPPLAAAARPLLTPTLFCVLTLSLVRLDTSAICGWLRRPAPLVGLLAWFLIGCPIVLAVVLSETPLDDATRAAFVLFAAAPPITVIPAYAMILGLNAALATVILTLTSVAAPFVLPVIALVVIGLDIDITASAFAVRLLLLIGTSFLAAAVVRRVVGAQTLDARASQINGLIVLAMLVLALAIMDGVTAQLLANPLRVIAFAGGVVLANLCLQLLTATCFWWLGRNDALTAGLTGGYRNSILLLAVVGASASPELGLLAATAQIAVYILPALQRPIFKAMGFRPT